MTLSVSRSARVWLVASLAVLGVWLLGSLVDRTTVAYGQTVPGAPQQISSTASNIPKRRPQLTADPATGGIYMVWEEGVTSTNNSNLYFAYRDPGTGTWTAPSLVANPASVNYAGRWGAVGTLVNETHAHIHTDPAGNLHVVYAAERMGSIGKGAYYTVGTGTTNPGTASWTDPVRIDMTTYAPAAAGYLLNLDNTRLFVRSDPAAVYGSVGYVLWVGNNGNQLRLTRVGYGPAHAPVTPLDAAPLTNPVSTSVGPVAVLEVDANTLELVYAGTNLQTGNGFWSAPLALNGGAAPTWGARVNVAGANGNDCNISVCNGGTAMRDAAGNTWVVANYDVTTTHGAQTTAHDGTAQVFAEILSDAPKTGRQPVTVLDTTGASTGVILLYNHCTYVSASSCTGRDIAYRVYSGGAWGAANVTGATTGDQLDIAATMIGDDLFYVWVGQNQGGAGTGQQAYFHWVQDP